MDRLAVLTVILVLNLLKSVFALRLHFDLLNQLLGSLFVELLHLVFCLNILLYLAQVGLYDLLVQILTYLGLKAKRLEDS